MIVFSLWVVRHGQTLYNKQNIIQGQLDVPLSPIGIQQATSVGECLQNEVFSHVYSSDLERAKQTAEQITKLNRSFRGSIIYDERLRERKFGDCEGKGIKELKEAAAKANKSLSDFCPPDGETLKQLYNRVVSFFGDLCQTLKKENSGGETGPCTSEGKSDADSKRDHSPVINGQESKIASSDSKQSQASPADGVQQLTTNVLLVSHGGFIKELIRHLFDDLCCRLPSNTPEAVIRITPNASISKFNVCLGEDGEPAITCTQLHDRRHLLTTLLSRTAVCSDADVAL